MTTGKPMLAGLPVSEAKVEQAVVDLFWRHHWEARRIREEFHNPDGRGMPDLLCTSPYGLQLWLEMKRPPSIRNKRGRVRKAQKELLVLWRTRGVPCCVIDEPLDCLVFCAANTDRDRETAVAVCDLIMVPYDWWPA
jgi:hypothetical protein